VNLRGKPFRVTATLLAAGGVLTACSTTGPASGAGSDKAVPGVTDKTITLGLLATITGPLAALGSQPVWGLELWADDVNAAGGVCGRQIVLSVLDTAGDVQRASTLYAANKSKVFAIPMSGSANVVAGLSGQLEADKMIDTPGSWASTLLRFPTTFVTAATYDVEMINGLGYLVDSKVLKAGDKVGHIYIEGEFGENGLMGSEFISKARGLDLISQQMKPTDTDLSSIVVSMKNQGVKALLVTGTPGQLASIAASSQSIGMKVPIVTNHNGYLKDLLSTPAKDALMERLIVADSMTPFDAPGNADAKDIAQKFAKKHPDKLNVVNPQINWSYATGEIYQAMMEKACAADDLTREGLLKAFQSSTDVKSKFVPALTFSPAGTLPSKAIFLARPSEDTSGLKIIEPDYSVPEAADYKGPVLK
jgi:ABC-type branched-subunit amino acid transport system substrate-binding protein